MIVPSENQIIEAARSKVASDSAAATLNDADAIARLLSTLELENDWSSISEKKFRSILLKDGLIADSNTQTSSSQGERMTSNGSTSTSNAKGTTSSSSSSKKKKKSKADSGIPKSFIDDSVTVPAGIRTEYFNSIKGKGLLATRQFKEGEVLFTEEAYIPVPPPEGFAKIVTGELCAQCFLPISSAPSQISVKDCPKCKHRFCTSNCYRTALHTHHTLLCVGYNPAAKKLLEIIQSEGWQSLHSVSRSLARLLSTLTSQNNNPKDANKIQEQFGTFETVFGRLSSFATVSELERRARNPGWATERPSFERILQQAHLALREALDPFYETRESQRQDSLSSGKSFEPHHVKIVFFDSVKARKGQVKDLFEYSTFLKLLGRSNVNMEKFGGLYSLHSFLNHSCSPNVQIRHVPERGVLASMKIAALALRDIPPEQELLISYIDPSWSLARRQTVLYRDYCFGPCTCDRCQAELDALGLRYDRDRESVKSFLDSIASKTGGTGKQNGDENLEEELRASLGF